MKLAEGFGVLLSVKSSLKHSSIDNCWKWLSRSTTFDYNSCSRVAWSCDPACAIHLHVREHRVIQLLRLRFHYLHQGRNVFASVCLFVCLSVSNISLLKKFLTDFHKIFRIARQWHREQLITFWGWSGLPFRRCTGKRKMLHFWQCHMGVLSGAG